MKTLFEKIIDKEEPAEFMYEDDKFVIIKSKFPSAPTHLLIIPRKVIPSIAEATPADTELVGELMLLAAKFAREQGIANYKLVFNAGKYLHVPHLHLHLLGGEDLE